LREGLSKADREEFKQAKKRAQKLALEFVEGTPGLLFYGECGTGKTHLLVGILREILLGRGFRARFIEFGHLLADLRRSYGDRSKGQDLITPLAETPLLVIDELGQGRGTEWELSVLDELISRRYNANRTTLFASNFYPHKAEGEPKALLDMVGERIVSRLKEMCVWTEVKSFDHRADLQPTSKNKGR